MSPEIWNEPPVREKYTSAKEQLFNMLKAKKPTSEKGVEFRVDDFLRVALDMNMPNGVRPIRLAEQLAEGRELDNIGDPEQSRMHKQQILAALSLVVLVHEGVALTDKERVDFITSAMDWSEAAESKALAQNAYMTRRERRNHFKALEWELYVEPMRLGLEHAVVVAATATGHAASRKGEADYYELSMAAARQRDHSRRALNIGLDTQIIGTRHEVPLRMRSCLAKLRRPLIYTLQERQ